MNDKINFSCPECGMVLEASADMAGAEVCCPGCNTHMLVPGPEEEPRNSPIMDLSDDRVAMLYRWLKVAEFFLFANFALETVGLLTTAVSTGICVAVLINLIARFILCRGVRTCARWARISVFVFAVISILLTLVASSSGFLDYISCIALILAALILLLPNVASPFKEISDNRGANLTACRLFWVLTIISVCVACFCAADAEPLDLGVKIPCPPMVLVGCAISAVLSAVQRFVDKILDGVDGRTESGYGKMRDAHCPKCGGVFSVPDIDTYSAPIECPHCKKAIFPFGSSKLAEVAFALGILSLLTLVPAPFALAAGLRSRRTIKNNRGMNGLSYAWAGIVLGGICSVALLFVIIAIVIY